MKKSMLLGLGLVLLVGAGVLLAAANVTGDWEMTSKGRNGQERKSTINFTQDGEKLTVKMAGMGGQEMTGTGTVKENDIEWSFTVTNPQGGDMTLTFKGKIDGDKMSGTRQMGDRPASDWTAVRKPK